MLQTITRRAPPQETPSPTLPLLFLWIQPAIPAVPLDSQQAFARFRLILLLRQNRRTNLGMKLIAKATHEQKKKEKNPRGAKVVAKEGKVLIVVRAAEMIPMKKHMRTMKPMTRKLVILWTRKQVGIKMMKAARM